MSTSKTFDLLGYEATLVDNRIEVSVPDENEAHKIVMCLYKAILDGKLQSLRITLPSIQHGIVGRHIFITRQDKNRAKFRATELN